MVPAKIGDLGIQAIHEHVYEYEPAGLVQGDFTRYQPLAVIDVDYDGQPTLCMSTDGYLVEPEGPLYTVPRERLKVPADEIIEELDYEYNNSAHLQEALYPYIDQHGHKKLRCSRVDEVMLTVSIIACVLFALSLDPPLRWKPVVDIIEAFGLGT